MPPGHDIRADAPVVEREQHRVVDHDVAPPRPVLQLLDLGEQLCVVVEEPVPRLPVALDERVPDEQFPRQRRVDAAVVDQPPGDDRNAVQRHAFVGHHRAALAVPVRLAVGALDQVIRQRFQPLRLDARADPGPQPVRLNEFGRHDPARGTAEQRRAGKHREARAAGTEVVALLRILHADVRKESGQQGPVDLRRLRGGAVQRTAEGTGDLADLGVQVLPFAHPQVVEEFGAAQLAELVAGQLLLLVHQVVPQVQVTGEVRLLVAEPGVRLGCGVLPVGRPLARVLNGQCGRDDEHLAQRALLVAGEHHAPQPRVDGYLGQAPAQFRQLVVGVQRAEFDEQFGTVADRAPVRRVEERELGDLAQAQCGHLQDDRREVGAQDLRVGELRPGQEVLLVVEPDADALGDPAAAAGALVRRRLRHRFDRQPLHLQPVAVPGDARGTRIDHVPDPGYRQRGLRHVGRQHDAPAGVRGEDPVLLHCGQSGEQRQDLGTRSHPAGERVGGVPDLPLAGQEHQDVARPFSAQLVDRRADRLDLVGLLVRRPVPQLHRVCPTGHLDDRRVVEVMGEPLDVDGRGGDHDLEIRPAGQQPPEVPEDEVDVQAALVRLVDDQRVVPAQQPVLCDLGEQDPVGHQLDPGLPADPGGEPDLVPDDLAERRVQLLGDALGDGTGGQAARLGVPDQAGAPPAQLQADLGQLGGLAGAGLPRDDHHLVVPDRRQDVVLAPGERQLGGVAQGQVGHAARIGGPAAPGPAFTAAPRCAAVRRRGRAPRERRPRERRPAPR